jgi:hypothetical protein
MNIHLLYFLKKMIQFVASLMLSLSLFFITISHAQQSVELSSILSDTSTLASLAHDVQYTVKSTIALSDSLVLRAAPGRSASLLCASTCFKLNGYSLTLSHINVVFGGTAPTEPAAVLFIDSDMRNANSQVTFDSVNATHAFGSADKRPFPLIAFEDNSALALITISYCTLHVTSLFASANALLANAQTTNASTSALAVSNVQVFSVTLANNAITCTSPRECIAFVAPFNLFLFTNYNTIQAVSTAANAVDIRGDSAMSSVSITGMDVPTNIGISFDTLKSLTVAALSLDAASSMTVREVNTVSLTNVTANADVSMIVANCTFVTVDRFRATSNAVQCTPVPVLVIDTASVATLKNSTLKGAFCTNATTVEYAVVMFSRMTRATVFGSEFSGFTHHARALFFDDVDVTKIEWTDFLDSKVNMSGFVRVQGSPDLTFGAVLNVENCNFRNVTSAKGSVIDINQVSSTFSSVQFSNISVTHTKPSAIWIDNTFRDAVRFPSNLTLEGVTFRNNTAMAEIVLADISSQSSARVVQLTKVRIESNTANVILQFYGVADAKFNGLFGTNNTGRSVLTIGSTNGNQTLALSDVCLCSNVMSTNGIECPNNAQLSSSANSMVAVQNFVCASSAVPGCSTTSACSAATTVGTTTPTMLTTTPKPVTPNPTPGPTPDPTRGPTTAPATTTTSSSGLSGTTSRMSETTSGISGTTGTTDSNGNSTDSPILSPSSSSSLSASTAENAEVTAPTTGTMSIWSNPAVVGGLAGGIIGFVLLVLLVIAAAVYFVRRRARGEEQASVPMQTQTPTTTLDSASSVPIYGKSSFSNLE